MKPDRIVVGVDNEKSKKIFEEIYRPFTLNNHPIIFMDIPSSEMTKYAANAFLATKISFINDISNLCERTGANVNFVKKELVLTQGLMINLFILVLDMVVLVFKRC